MSFNTFDSKKAGPRKDAKEPRLVGEVIVDNLAKSSEQPFSGIRQQLALGNLPNLAQRLAATTKKRKEECAVC